MIPEFDQFPVFYFSNHLTVIGPGELRVGRRRLEQLDFELEAFCVIGKKVTNPTLEEADDAIFGYGVMNDFSARALQAEEMKLNLGPAKGKDFATALGPWLVTKDELEAEGRLVKTTRGNVIEAAMTAEVNGLEVSRGDLAQMNWTFAQIVQRAADGVELEPGEVIGSGTVGTGCFLELNGSKVTQNQWLKPGDSISLTIDGLGTLTNHVVEDPRDDDRTLSRSTTTTSGRTSRSSRRSALSPRPTTSATSAAAGPASGPPSSTSPVRPTPGRSASAGRTSSSCRRRRTSRSWTTPSAVLLAAQEKHRKHLKNLTREKLERPFSWTNLSGEVKTSPFEIVVRHVVNHQTYHRGQIASMVRRVGGKPIATDMVRWGIEIHGSQTSGR